MAKGSDAGYHERMLASRIEDPEFSMEYARARREIDQVDSAQPPIAASPAGDSREQREAEPVMVAELSAELGVVLAPREIRLSDGSRVKVDGASGDLSVLCEAWAHQGRPKSAQRNKVIVDAFKLSHVARSLGTSPRLILLFSDDTACAPFTRSGWAAGALRTHGIELKVVPLPDDLRQRVVAAQARQFR
jgi:hypothetical protein